MTLLTPLATPYRWGILSCRFLMGCGEGVNFPCVFNLFSHWIPKEEQSFLVSIAQTGAYCGSIFSMLLVPPIESLLDLESCFLHIWHRWSFVVSSIPYIWFFHSSKVCRKIWNR